METAHRALRNCGQVLCYAVATGRADRNIAADLIGALPPVKGSHFAAVTEPDSLKDLLIKLDSYQGSSLVVSSALKLSPLLFVRPGELRTAEWKDMDLEKAEWRYRISKTDTLHIVPLARQAVEILEELRRVERPGPYVFPGAHDREKPMSDNAVLKALRRLGITKQEMTGHGFRATARTILDEVLGFRPDFIECQLGHSVKDSNGRAYNRTSYLPERKQMMEGWADYLENLKRGNS